MGLKLSSDNLHTLGGSACEILDFGFQRAPSYRGIWLSGQLYFQNSLYAFEVFTKRLLSSSGGITRFWKLVSCPRVVFIMRCGSAQSAGRWLKKRHDFLAFTGHPSVGGRETLKHESNAIASGPRTWRLKCAMHALHFNHSLELIRTLVVELSYIRTSVRKRFGGALAVAAKGCVHPRGGSCPASTRSWSISMSCTLLRSVCGEI
jgi:hypothetical protein